MHCTDKDTTLLYQNLGHCLDTLLHEVQKCITCPAHLMAASKANPVLCLCCSRTYRGIFEISFLLHYILPVHLLAASRAQPIFCLWVTLEVFILLHKILTLHLSEHILSSVSGSLSVSIFFLTVTDLTCPPIDLSPGDRWLRTRRQAK